MAPLFGYWDLRGLAEPIRLLLHHVGETYDEKLYEMKTPRKHEMDRSEWLKEKFTLGLPFPNLPYYIDGDVKLTQSLAILRYLARKHNLDANSEQERQTLDVLEQQMTDLSDDLATLAYRPDFATKKDEYIKNLPDKLKLLENWLDGKTWFVGDRLTFVDFLAYEAVDFHREIHPTCLDEFPNLHSFMGRLEELPNIKKYMNNRRVKKWPLYTPYAQWGYYK